MTTIYLSSTFEDLKDYRRVVYFIQPSFFHLRSKSILRQGLVLLMGDE